MSSFQLSIIVPVYNAESHLDKCLRSIINASKTIKSEILLIDDGSTDKSAEICERLCELYSSIKIINSFNKGPSRARNMGLDIANGDYIAFVDSDDLVAPNMFLELLKIALKNNSDIVVCNYFEGANNNYNAVTHFLNNNRYENNFDIISNVISKYYTNKNIGLVQLWNKIFRRGFIIDQDLKMNESLYRGEDWWFTLHAFEKANIVCFTDKVLYYYNADTPGSLMKRLDLNFYYEWKYSHLYLLNRNQEYQFSLDYNLFFGGFLFNAFSLLVKFSNSKKAIKIIVDDSFYKLAIKHDKFTSLPVRFSHFLNKYFPFLQAPFFKAVRLLMK